MIGEREPHAAGFAPSPPVRYTSDPCSPRWRANPRARMGAGCCGWKTQRCVLRAADDPQNARPPTACRGTTEDPYRDALEQLHRGAHTFACTQRAASGKRHLSGNQKPRYAYGALDSTARCNGTMEFDDGVATPSASAKISDFVVSRRTHHCVSTHRSSSTCPHITHVVRGADLLDNTPRQLLLFRCSAPGPSLRTRTGADDRSGRLSKQTHITRSTHVPRPTTCGSSPPARTRSAGKLRGTGRPLLVWGAAQWNLSEYRAATPNSCAYERRLLPSTPSAGAGVLWRVLLLDPDVARRDRLCRGLTGPLAIGIGDRDGLAPSTAKHRCLAPSAGSPTACPSRQPDPVHLKDVSVRRRPSSKASDFLVMPFDPNEMSRRHQSRLRTRQHAATKISRHGDDELATA